jgi:hypothetical protein
MDYVELGDLGSGMTSPKMSREASRLSDGDMPQCASGILRPWVAVRSAGYKCESRNLERGADVKSPCPVDLSASTFREAYDGVFLEVS